eukprot:scaffold273814_cov86-Cyclotella_meneghiniana.AAC.1
MQSELATDYNFDSVDGLTHEDVEDYYEVKDVVTARIDELAEAVPFSLCAITNELELDRGNHWQGILEFVGWLPLVEQRSGIIGSDTHRQVADEKEKGDVVIIVLGTEGLITRKDSSIYKLMPEMIIKFAEDSRIDNGFRLLARTVRHSFDSRGMLTMKECSAKLIVHIRSKIPSSMKKNNWTPRGPLSQP